MLAGALVPVSQPNDGWGSYLFGPLAPRSDMNATVDDDQPTYTAKLSWSPTAPTMFYASYLTGFKAGGTNTDRIDPTFNQLFGPETSESIELGFEGLIGPVDLRTDVPQELRLTQSVEHGATGSACCPVFCSLISPGLSSAGNDSQPRNFRIES